MILDQLKSSKFSCEYSNEFSGQTYVEEKNPICESPHGKNCCDFCHHPNNPIKEAKTDKEKPFDAGDNHPEGKDHSLIVTDQELEISNGKDLG